jgi:hypothetical protein
VILYHILFVATPLDKSCKRPRRIPGEQVAYNLNSSAIVVQPPVDILRPSGREAHALAAAATAIHLAIDVATGTYPPLSAELLLEPIPRCFGKYPNVLAPDSTINIEGDISLPRNLEAHIGSAIAPGNNKVSLRSVVNPPITLTAFAPVDNGIGPPSGRGAWPSVAYIGSPTESTPLAFSHGLPRVIDDAVLLTFCKPDIRIIDNWFGRLRLVIGVVHPDSDVVSIVALDHGVAIHY